MPIVKRFGQPDLFYLIDDYTNPWDEAPWLVLQHGFCRGAKFWVQWVPHLARHFRIIRPDMRGVGQSGRDFSWQQDLTVANLAADLLAVADHAGAQSLHFCGESLGGIVGMVVASEQPARVRSLSLISTPARINANAQERYAFGHGSIVAAIEAMGVRAWVRASSADTRFPPDTPPAMFDWFCDSMAEAGADAIVEYSRFLQTADVTAWLPGIQAPVLSLYPSGGSIASDDQKNTLQQHIADIRFVHVPTAYHMIQHILPEQCAREVLQFCAAVDGRSDTISAAA